MKKQKIEKGRTHCVKCGRYVAAKKDCKVCHKAVATVESVPGGKTLVAALKASIKQKERKAKKFHMCDQIIDFAGPEYPRKTCRKRARYGIQVIGNMFDPNTKKYEPINPEGNISSFYCAKHAIPFRHKNHKEIHKVVPV